MNVLTAIAYVALAVQVFAIVICFVHGRWVMGLIGLFVAPVAWVGALLPAKPMKPLEIVAGE